MSVSFGRPDGRAVTAAASAAGQVRFVPQIRTHAPQQTRHYWITSSAALLWQRRFSQTLIQPIPLR